MALTDAGTSSPHITGSAPYFFVTAGGTWVRGDPIGLSGGSFVRADDDGGIVARWIAGTDAVSGREHCKLHASAICTGDRYSGGVAGSILYLSDTAGRVGESAGTNSRVLGVTIGANSVFLDPTLQYTPTLSGFTITSGAVVLNNGLLLNLGSDSDIALVERASILGANTALTGVIVGTPVTPAVAADSLILSNITADGDILIATQTGGNSHAYLWIDASAALLTLYAGAGVIALQANGTSVNLINDILLTLGTGGDAVLVERSTVLTANTTLSGVVVGTPVTPALAADTLIIANVTADGDIVLITQTGGNSHAAMWVDASAAITRFYSGAGIEVLKLDSAALTATGTLTVTGLATLQASATVTGQVAHGAASDGSTPGVSVAGFKAGTPPVGAATTTSKIYASATVMRKIIADGTDSVVG